MLNSTRLKSSLLALVSASLMTAAIVAPASASGYIANYDAYVISVEDWDTLNMRKWPASYSQKVSEIPHDGQWIRVQRCIDKEYGSDWCKVKYDGNWGWVNSRYLSQHD